VGAVVVSVATRAIIHKARKTHQQTPGHFQVYESEVLKGEENPVWDPFRLDFYWLCKGEMDVQVLIECYAFHRIGSSTLLGSFVTKVRDLVSGGGFQFYDESGNENSAQLNVKAKLSSEKIICCDFKVNANDLAERGLLGSSDPYLVVKTQDSIPEPENTIAPGSPLTLTVPFLKVGGGKHRATEGRREVYESLYYKKNLNPDWDPFRISFYDLCRGNLDVDVIFEIWDYNSILSNKWIGCAIVTIKQLLESSDKNEPLTLDLQDQNNEFAGKITIETSAYSK